MDVGAVGDRYEIFISYEILTKRAVSFEDSPFLFTHRERLGDELSCRSPDAPFDCYRWAFLNPQIISEQEGDMGSIYAGTSRWPTVMPLAVYGRPAGSFTIDDETYLYPSRDQRFRTPDRKIWEFSRGSPVFVTFLSSTVDRDFSGDRDVGRAATRELLQNMTHIAVNIAREHEGIVHDDFHWYSSRVSVERLAKRQWMNMEEMVDYAHLSDLRKQDIAALAEREHARQRAEIRKTFVAHNGLGEGKERAVRDFKLYP